MVGFSRLILLLVVFIINTINLKDSINGLVSKLSMSALGIYGVLFLGGAPMVVFAGGIRNGEYLDSVLLL